MDIWPVVHGERKTLLSDLAGLSEDQWSSPSLCDEWTVRDVVAHMAATAKMTPPKFFGEFIGSGFSFPSVQAKGIAAERGNTPADTRANLESVLTSVKHPPGPSDTMLGEVIVHSEDIRRPLGIRHEYPQAAVIQAADFFKRSNLIIGTKRRIAGVTLRATDADWSHGTGPEAAGPMLSLLLAMTGRKPALDDLTGDGVAVLRSRP